MSGLSYRSVEFPADQAGDINVQRFFKLMREKVGVTDIVLKVMGGRYVDGKIKPTWGPERTVRDLEGCTLDTFVMGGDYEVVKVVVEYRKPIVSPQETMTRQEFVIETLERFHTLYSSAANYVHTKGDAIKIAEAEEVFKSLFNFNELDAHDFNISEYFNDFRKEGVLNEPQAQS